MSSPAAFSRPQLASYSLLALPLAFAALPLYVLLPNLYARDFGMPLATLGAVLLAARAFDAFTDPLLGRLADRLGRDGLTVRMLGYLVEADHSGRPPLPGGMPESMQRILGYAQDLAILDARPQPLLLGRHLIALGMTPGPHFKVLLNAAYEAQLNALVAKSSLRTHVVECPPEDITKSFRR